MISEELSAAPRNNSSKSSSLLRPSIGRSTSASAKETTFSFQLKTGTVVVMVGVIVRVVVAGGATAAAVALSPSELPTVVVDGLYEG